MENSNNEAIIALSNKGIEFAKNGDLRKAIKCFKKALELAPSRPDLLNNVGLTLYRIGDYDEAITCLNKALTVDPNHVDALYNMGYYLAYNKMNYAEAITHFVKALLINPNRTDILFHCGFSHLMLGNIMTTTSIFPRIIEIDPSKRNYQELMTLLRYVSAILGKDEENMAMIDSSLANSDGKIPLYLRARLKVVQGKTEEALTLLKEAINKDSAFKAVAKQDKEFHHLLFNDTRFRELIGLTFSQEDIDEINQLLSVAADYYKRQDYESAIDVSMKVLSRQQKLLGDHFLLSDTLDNLFVSCIAMGEFLKGFRFFEQKLEMIGKTRGENSHDFVDTLYNLANAYYQFGNYEGANSLYERAIEITRKTLGNTPNFSSLLTSFAIFNLHFGDYQKTESLYKEAIEVERKNPLKEYTSLIQSLNRLARLYQKLGNYRDAESICKQAVEIAGERLGGDSLVLADSLANLAFFYLSVGNYPKAKSLLEQNLEICRKLGENSQGFAQGLNDLASICQLMKNYDEAESLYKQAIEIYKKAGKEKSFDYAATLCNSAYLFQKMKNYDEAESLYKQAIQITKESDNAFNSSVIQWNLATLYHIMKNYQEAERLYKETIETFQKKYGNNHPDLISLLETLSLLYNDMGDYYKAITILEHSFHIFDKIITILLSISSQEQRMAYLSRILSSFYLYISLILQHFSNSDLHQSKALELVFKRKGIAFEAAYTQREVLTRKYPKLAPKLNELKKLRSEIAEKSISGPTKGESKSYNKLLAELNAKKVSLEEELARQIPETDLEAKFDTINITNIAKALPKGSVLVEFVEIYTLHSKSESMESKGPHYVAFILHSGKPNKMQLVDLGSSKSIDEMIKEFRKSVMAFEDNSNKSSQAVNGNALRKSIFDPLLSSFEDKKELLIAPDGNLTLLPFEILPTADGRRLIDDFKISYLGTGRDVLRFKRSSGKLTAAEPLVIADPDFDLNYSNSQKSQMKSRILRSIDFNTGTVKKFDRLDGTREEGKRIADLLRVVPWVDKNALEGKIKSVMSPLILHVASHAFFLPNQEKDNVKEERNLALSNQEQGLGKGLTRLQRLENPMLRSGIALAGANITLEGKLLVVKEAEDGILTAEDVVSGLDLSSTELVVLSACETGVGEIEIGEGIFGLRRSFILAGAQTLVMSMWQVDDEITQELMDFFYKNLLKGEPCAEALRNAQLIMKKKYSQPYFWGAFICQGNPYPISIEPVS